MTCFSSVKHTQTVSPNVKFYPGHLTDHSLVTVEINLDVYIRGPGTWKLNNKLLENEEYIKEINNTIFETVQDTPHLNPKNRWTEIKCRCVQNSKSFSKQMVRDRKNLLGNLINLAENLKEDRLCNTENRDVLNGLRQVTSKIEAIERMNVESCIFRSRCKWVEHGERNSKMFFSLEKRNYMAKNMKLILTDSGKHITDQKAILEEQTKFYKSLYSKKPQCSVQTLKRAERKIPQ